MTNKKNNYTPTDVNYHGGLEYGANIHSVSVQVNQYVWDMMKLLEKHELYGFDFESKIGTSKTVVILRHEDIDLLKKATDILKYSHEDVDFLFITRVKKKRKDKRVWILLGLSLFILVIALLLYYLYINREIFLPSLFVEDSKKTTHISKEPVIQDIEIDMDKLKAFKDSFSKDDNKPVDDKTMKVLEITTSVISSMVSEEEKEKYSSKNLVESFKGKGGIRFVAKDGNLSKDFNATVKELNGYANKFIKDKNNRLALQAFDRALDVNMTKSNQDDILKSLAGQGELYENLGDINSSKNSYSKLSKITTELAKENFVKYGLIEATVTDKLITLYRDTNETELSNKAMISAEKLYKMVIEELKKSSKGKRIDNEKLALALNYLANFYENRKKDYYLSIEIRKEALEIYQKLSKKKPKKFKLAYYKTINSLGNSYLALKKISLADEAYTKGLSITRKLPKRSLYYRALSYRALALLEIEREEFKIAEKYYHKSLTIYKKILKRDSREFIEIDTCFAYLEEKRGHSDLAEKLYKKAIIAYKAKSRELSLDYNLDVSKVLNQLAKLYISNKQKSVDAEIKLFESISLAKKVTKIETKEANGVLAESYRSLAYLAIEEGNMQSAWDYYKKANSLKKS